MITYRFSRQRNRRFKVLYLAVIIALLVSLFPQVVGQPIPTALAHNLQTRFFYMYMDPATQAMLDARMAAPGWLPPTALLQVNDELGIVIKVMPKDGTNTGVGGHAVPEPAAEPAAQPAAEPAIEEPAARMTS